LTICDVAVAAGRIVGWAGARRLHAQPRDRRRRLHRGPGLVDLAARLREPGHEHEGMLEAKWPPPWPVA
jgi:dihydroorotase